MAKINIGKTEYDVENFPISNFTTSYKAILFQTVSLIYNFIAKFFKPTIVVYFQQIRFLTETGLLLFICFYFDSLRNLCQYKPL